MLPLSFFVIALLYSTVGFGGGSSYLAMLTVANVPFQIMPKIALVCNLLVVSGGTWNYWKKGLFNRRLILPFVLSSVPAAFLGGMYRISEIHFMILLTSCLILAGTRLLFVVRPSEEETFRPSDDISAIVGALLGFLSGMVALGGGIFLAPLMLNLKWGKPKEVAATACAFILLNSAAGLSGQIIKDGYQDILEYWPLFLSVFIGGQIGSRIGTHKKVSHALIQRGTAILILFISARLLFKLI